MIPLTHGLLTFVFVGLAVAAIMRRLPILSVAVLAVASVLLILPIVLPAAVQNGKFIALYFAATGAAMVAGIVLFARNNRQHV